MDKSKLSKNKYLYRIVKGSDNIYNIEKNKIIYINKKFVYIKGSNDNLIEIPFHKTIDFIDINNIYDVLCNVDKTGYSYYTFKIDLEFEINYYNHLTKKLISELINELNDIERQINYYNRKKQDVKSKLGQLLIQKKE